MRALLPGAAWHTVSRKSERLPALCTCKVSQSLDPVPPFPGDRWSEVNVSASRHFNDLSPSRPLVASHADQPVGGRSLQRRWRIRSRAPITRKVPEICVETPVLPARLGRPTMTPTLKKASACDSISGCSLCSRCVSRALLMISGFPGQRAVLQLKWHCLLGLFLYDPGFSPNRPVLVMRPGWLSVLDVSCVHR